MSAVGVSRPAEAATRLSESPGEETRHFVSLSEVGDQIPSASRSQERCRSQQSVQSPEFSPPTPENCISFNPYSEVVKEFMHCGFSSSQTD